ncbi:MAG: DUF2085 domain-containing protein [Methanobacteriaceae archaeon]|jgi:uncharacterized membrane protein|nr:DUF2085 domain-containing protein [Methanobacteriaceae archaeon]
MSLIKIVRKKFLRGHIICHGLPERSFKIKGHQFPVCARCTGIYLGSFSVIGLVMIFNPVFNPLLLIMGFLMIIPTFIDGLTQYLNHRESNNNLRFITGLIGGIGMAIVITSLRFIPGLLGIPT